MPVCVLLCPSLPGTGGKTEENEGKRARDYQVATWHHGLRGHRGGGVEGSKAKSVGTVLDRGAATRVQAPTPSRAVHIVDGCRRPAARPQAAPVTGVWLDPVTDRGRLQPPTAATQSPPRVGRSGPASRAPRRRPDRTASPDMTVAQAASPGTLEEPPKWASGACNGGFGRDRGRACAARCRGEGGAGASTCLVGLECNPAS